MIFYLIISRSSFLGNTKGSISLRIVAFFYDFLVIFAINSDNSISIGVLVDKIFFIILEFSINLSLIAYYKALKELIVDYKGLLLVFFLI